MTYDEGTIRKAMPSSYEHIASLLPGSREDIKQTSITINKTIKELDTGEWPPLNSCFPNIRFPSLNPFLGTLSPLKSQPTQASGGGRDSPNCQQRDTTYNHKPNLHNFLQCFFLLGLIISGVEAFVHTSPPPPPPPPHTLDT